MKGTLKSTFCPLPHPDLVPTLSELGHFYLSAALYWLDILFASGTSNWLRTWVGPPTLSDRGTAWKQRHHWDVWSEKWQKTIAVLSNLHSPRRKQGLGVNGKHRTGLTNKILGEPLRTGGPDFTLYITYLLAFLPRFWMLGTHISIL